MKSFLKFIGLSLLVIIIFAQSIIIHNLNFNISRRLTKLEDSSYYTNISPTYTLEKRQYEEFY